MHVRCCVWVLRIESTLQHEGPGHLHQNNVSRRPEAGGRVEFGLRMAMFFIEWGRCLGQEQV